MNCISVETRHEAINFLESDLALLSIEYKIFLLDSKVLCKAPVLQKVVKILEIWPRVKECIAHWQNNNTVYTYFMQF